MSDKTYIQEAARFLFEERQAGHSFTPIPAPYTPHHLDQAYAVQEAFQQRLVAVSGPIAGYKIALTTPVMQQMVGVSEPIAGAILARTIHHSPARVQCTDYVHLGVECEIAVQLAADLPAQRAPYTRDSVADAIGTVRAAFELVDDRHADYAQLAPHIFSLLADNAWNAGIVLGPAVTDWRTLDLAAARGTMRINAEIVGEGHGRDVLGHPLEALAWLANMFAKQGKSLSQGTTIMTGSVVATKFVTPADVVELAVAGLGEVSLRVE